MSAVKGQEGGLGLWELHHGRRSLEAENVSSPAESPPDHHNKRRLDHYSHIGPYIPQGKYQHSRKKWILSQWMYNLAWFLSSKDGRDILEPTGLWLADWEHPDVTLILRVENIQGQDLLGLWRIQEPWHNSRNREIQVQIKMRKYKNSMFLQTSGWQPICAGHDVNKGKAGPLLWAKLREQYSAGGIALWALA